VPRDARLTLMTRVHAPDPRGRSFSMAAVELLKPAANDVLQRWPVSRRVNSSKAPADDATLIENRCVGAHAEFLSEMEAPRTRRRGRITDAGPRSSSGVGWRQPNKTNEPTLKRPA
jgi:hypothetical protein